jgi:hypothetical protein
MSPSIACRPAEDRGAAPRAGAPHGARTDATGSRRRLQALAYLCWSQWALATRLGTSPMFVRRIQAGGQGVITTARAAAVAALYDELWDQYPCSRQAEWVRTRARQAGWVPPLAWDDDAPGDYGYTGHGIDDPAAVPAPGWQRPQRTRLTPADQAAELAELVSLGLSLNRAALRLGVSGATLQRLRDRVAVAS